MRRGFKNYFIILRFGLYLVSHSHSFSFGAGAIVPAFFLTKKLLNYAKV